MNEPTRDPKLANFLKSHNTDWIATAIDHDRADDLLAIRHPVHVRRSRVLSLSPSVSFYLSLRRFPRSMQSPEGDGKFEARKEARVRVYRVRNGGKYDNGSVRVYIIGGGGQSRKDYRAKISDNGALVVCLHRERVHSRCNSGTCKTFKDEACLGTRYASEKRRGGATPPRGTRLAPLSPSFLRENLGKGT